MNTRPFDRTNPGRRIGRLAALVVAGAVALSTLPAAAELISTAAAAASACRPTFLVSAPASAEIQKTVAITASVLNCNLSVFLGDCVLEAQVGSKFVTLDSGAVLGLGNCDFPTSSNTAAKRTFRIRFTGDNAHAPAVSRTFKINFGAPAATKGDMRLGLAFVNSSVTASGGRAALPGGATIFRPGSTITGTTGCPTSSFGQDGLMMLVLDYNGPPTSASVTTTITDAGSSSGFAVAPYYLDLNPGQQVQYLGPRSQNGTYDILVEYGYARASGFPKLTARFVLDRTCP